MVVVLLPKIGMYFLMFVSGEYEGGAPVRGGLCEWNVSVRKWRRG